MGASCRPALVRRSHKIPVSSMPEEFMRIVETRALCRPGRSSRHRRDQGGGQPGGDAVTAHGQQGERDKMQSVESPIEPNTQNLESGGLMGGSCGAGWRSAAPRRSFRGSSSGSSTPGAPVTMNTICCAHLPDQRQCSSPRMRHGGDDDTADQERTPAPIVMLML